MLTALLFFWLVLIPFPALAQEETPTPTPTETIVVPTETPTPTPTETPTPGPTATPTPAPSSSSTSSPTNTPTPIAVLKKTSTTQQGGFGGQGLVDEKDAVDTGLGYEKDKVLGSTTTQEVDSKGDGDLLLTLIFLTSTVVLVVWTIYIILVQKGIIKTDMKKNTQKVGITPQPLQ